MKTIERKISQFKSQFIKKGSLVGQSINQTVIFVGRILSQFTP